MEGPKQNYRVRSRLEVFYTGGTVRLSNDGALLACACADEVKLVDVETGAVVKTLEGDSEPITALALSPDGRLVFAGSRSLQLRCWSVDTGQSLRSFTGHKAPVAEMAVDATGTLLASAGADRTVRVWDIDGGFCTHSFTGHSGVVLCCVFHPTQLMLISGGDDHTVRVWDLVTRACVATLSAHFSAVTSLSLSSDGWTLLSGGRDSVVVAWSLRDFKKLATIPVYEAVEGVVALPPGGEAAHFPGVAAQRAKQGAAPPLCFATGGEKGVVKLWRADTAQCIYEGEGQEGISAAAAGGIVELRALPHCSGLLAATQDCRLLLLKPEDGELHAGRQLIGNNDEVTDLCFIAAQPQDAADAPTAAGAPPTHVAVSTNSEQIRLFDAATLSCTATLSGHQDIVLCLDSMRLASGQTLLASGAKDSTVRVWSAPQGRCLAVGKGHVAAVGAVAFSRRNGGFLVSGGADKLLKVWDVGALLLDVEDPAKLRATAAVAAHDKDINAVAVSPNDALVATGSQDRSAKVWQLPSLVPALTLRGHKRGVWSVAFSPVDQVLITAAGDKTIRLWALRDGACLRTFEGHLASVLRVTFLSAGTQLLSAGADGLLKLWSVRSSECTNTFDAHEGKAWALALGGQDGGLVATGGADGAIALWEDCTGEDAEDEAVDREVTLLAEQELANAEQRRDWNAAAALAFKMNHPGRLLSVVNKAFDVGPAAGTAVLDGVVGGMDSDGLRRCLEYCREWNTHSRTCFVAQATLHAVLRRHPPATLLAVPGVAPLLEALAPYTERHLSRANRLLQSTFLVDYILGAMNVLSPEDAGPNGSGVAVGNGDVQALNGGNGVHHGGASLANGHASHPESGSSSSSDEDEEKGAGAVHPGGGVQHTQVAAGAAEGTAVEEVKRSARKTRSGAAAKTKAAGERKQAAEVKAPKTRGSKKRRASG